MASRNLPDIPSLRRQQLWIEFATFKLAPPPGVYVNVSPNDPAFWSGVLFVQKGPYASAILRFQIRFPSAYPDSPPLITFTTDIFHPLVVPSTNNNNSASGNAGLAESAGGINADSIVAIDETDRLPVGSFSLRHGFPQWFDFQKKAAARKGKKKKKQGQAKGGRQWVHESDGEDSDAPVYIPGGYGYDAVRNGGDDDDDDDGVEVPVLGILNYIRRTFDDEDVLDCVPLSAAADPSAWHAWRAYRREQEGVSDDNETDPAADGHTTRASDNTPPRKWNWDGVWEKRAHAGIEASYLEATLFGNATRTLSSDDLIRFIKLDPERLHEIKRRLVPQDDSGNAPVDNGAIP